jgi:hypothetical protein
VSTFLRIFLGVMGALRVGRFEIWAGEFVAAQKVNENKSNGPENSADSGAPSLFAPGSIPLTQKFRSFVKMAGSSMRWAGGRRVPS